jgi:di/tricarboxylate transporter
MGSWFSGNWRCGGGTTALSSRAPEGAAGTSAVRLRQSFKVLAAFAVLVAAIELLSILAPTARTGIVVAAAIVFWSTALWPEHITAIAFFLVALLLNIAPPEVIFAGFSSPAFWMVFAGLILGVVVRGSGLADRLAILLTGRAGGSFAAVATMVVGLGLALTFVMPSSMGRVVMLVPIAMSLAEQLGYGADSKGRTGIVLAAVLGAYLPSGAVLPANLPNIVLAASAEQIYGVRLSYAAYFISTFPVLGFLKAVVIVGLLTLFYGEKPRRAVAKAGNPPWSEQERATAIVLFLSFAFWSTDFLHSISPAWIALGAALLCMMPRVELFPLASFTRDLNFVPVIHTAGIIGLGAVVAKTGLGDRLSQAFISIAPFADGANLANFMLLGLLSTLTGLVTTTTGVPAVLTPLSAALAKASGLPLEAVLMSQTVGFTNIVFPYEGAPIVFAMHAAGLRLRDLIRVLTVLAVITLLVLSPLTFGWWQFINYPW